MIISVIIPIFHVESFIERCVRSLMEQTMKDVEFIFVDDCSPDNSVMVLERVLNDYPQRKGQTRILHHETNRGLPAARNTGLEAAQGEYIFHCDSDDYLERDALEQMYNKAVETHADIVYSDWYLSFPRKKRYMCCPEYPTKEEVLRGLLHGTMKYNVWNKLVKRTLYDDIRFPEGHGMGEDMTIILLFAKTRRITYLSKATYHYVRQNENAFTASHSETSYIDQKYNADRTIAALQGEVPDGDIAAFKLNVKYPFLISNNKADYERWQAWYPEANTFIPSHQVSHRAQWLETCAARRWYLALWLHHLLITKIVYGIIYPAR